MNQNELIDAIGANPNNTGTSKATIKFVLEAQAQAVQSAVARGDDVTLPGICKISVSERAARTGRNPQTGDELQIPAKRVPKLSAIKALKDAAAG